MLDVSLFHSHFSSKNQVCNENYRGIGLAIHRFVDANYDRFNSFAKLRPFRVLLGESSSRKDMALTLGEHFDLKNMHPALSASLLSLFKNVYLDQQGRRCDNSKTFELAVLIPATTCCLVSLASNMDASETQLQRVEIALAAG